MSEEVSPLLDEVLNHKTERAVQALNSQIGAVAILDTPPQTYFQGVVKLAIEVLEGRITGAYVGELSPPIMDPAQAWSLNVNTLVHGALALCLCAQKPTDRYSPVLAFWLRFSALILEASPTARDVVDDQDPDLLEAASVGVFQSPEHFVRREACARIINEIYPLFGARQTLQESEETRDSVSHFHALLKAAERGHELALLKGYI
ncbi:MAG TPA: hypothetical protein VMH80_01530 [Bryobacteraceae bacterium]|nr:hypothetical protein [Bryobacteraceae bacterium]